MAIYLAGQEYDGAYIAGAEIGKIHVAGMEYQPDSLLAIGAQVGAAITIVVTRTVIYSGRDVAQGTALVAQLSDGTGVIDRQPLPFDVRGTIEITFSDGSQVEIERFPDTNTKFLILASGTSGSALTKTLTIYRAG